MRRASILQTQTSEPLIVVEDSGPDEFGEDKCNASPTCESSDEDCPTNFMNPYLLSPWRDGRDTRKNSLPTPQCSGITASQVRRLSERSEGNGPGPKQTEFLATLSTAPAPTPGGRRHSIVTISKVPNTLFGRSRRESVAVFASPLRILSSRRESIVGPPSTEPTGSVHNLQLDIMDDIVQARKVRMKLWKTSSEKLCEVEQLDESADKQKYTSSSTRRYSEFVGTPLAPIPSGSRRRASEMPPAAVPSTSYSSSASKKLSSGIVCSNTDLISILSSLTSSSTEINQQCESNKPDKKLSLDQKRSRLKTNRSNSFDVSILHGTQNKLSSQQEKPQTDWFIKRHQPMSTKVKTPNNNLPKVTFTSDNKKKDSEKENKVIWDGRSGSIVDAGLLGNAIEDFLRQVPETTIPISPNKETIPKAKFKTPTKAMPNLFSGRNEKEEMPQTCNSSICSTLKDMFVK